MDVPYSIQEKVVNQFTEPKSNNMGHGIFNLRSICSNFLKWLLNYLKMLKMIKMSHVHLNFHKSKFLVSCVKNTNFDAKKTLHKDIFLSFLHNAYNVSIFPRNFACAYRMSTCTHEILIYNLFSHF
jgi:hypothetical protein